MSPMNIHPEENVASPKKKNNKMLKVMLGIGALVLVPVIGTTLAGSINVTGGTENAAVFGQGIRSAVACDADVNLKASARYVYGSYKLDTVTVENLDGSACEGAILELSAADNGDTDISELGLAEDNTPNTVIRARADMNDTGGNLACDNVYFTCAFSNSTLTITIVNSNGQYGISALDVYKLLIQEVE
jgi:hypothetical protein